MPFMKWVKTLDGYKQVEITLEEVEAQNIGKKTIRQVAKVTEKHGDIRIRPSEPPQETRA